MREDAESLTLYFRYGFPGSRGTRVFRLKRNCPPLGQTVTLCCEYNKDGTELRLS